MRIGALAAEDWFGSECVVVVVLVALVFTYLCFCLWVGGCACVLRISLSPRCLAMRCETRQARVRQDVIAIASSTSVLQRLWERRRLRGRRRVMCIRWARRGWGTTLMQASVRNLVLRLLPTMSVLVCMFSNSTQVLSMSGNRTICNVAYNSTETTVHIQLRGSRSREA